MNDQELYGCVRCNQVKLWYAKAAVLAAGAVGAALVGAFAPESQEYLMGWCIGPAIGFMVLAKPARPPRK